MPTRAIIHVGFWKCGSTSLQHTLSRNAEFLYQKGYSYPPGDSYARQRSIIDFVHPNPSTLFWNRRNGITDEHRLNANKNKGMNFFKKIIGKSRDRVMLLSCEHYIAMPKDALRSFRNFIPVPDDEFKIVVYVRHPIAHARSAIQESVKQGVMDWDLALSNAKPVPYGPMLKKLSGVFGKDRIIVRDINKCRNGSTALDLLNIAGLPESHESDIHIVRSNSSLSMEGLQVASELYKIAPAFLRPGVRNPRRAPRDYLFNIKGRAITLPVDVENRLADESAADVAYLRDEWGVELERPSSREPVLLDTATAQSLAEVLNGMRLLIADSES